MNYLENQALFSTKILKDITKFVISFSNDWCFQGSKPYLSERAVTVQSEPNRLDISIFHVNYLENQALFSTKILKDITKFVISFSNDWCFQGSKPYLSERAVTVQSEPLLSIMAMSMKYIGKNGMCLFV